VELDDGTDHAGAEIAGLAGGDEVGACHCGLGWLSWFGR